MNFLGFKDPDGQYTQFFKILKRAKGFKNNGEIFRFMVKTLSKLLKEEIVNLEEVYRALEREEKNKKIIMRRKNRLVEYGVPNIIQEVCTMLVKKVAIVLIMGAIAETSRDYANLAPRGHKKQYHDLRHKLTPPYLVKWQKLLLYLSKGLGIPLRFLTDKNYEELLTFAHHKDAYVMDKVDNYFKMLKDNTLYIQERLVLEALPIQSFKELEVKHDRKD